jgi:hypothetical protein
VAEYVLTFGFFVVEVDGLGGKVVVDLLAVGGMEGFLFAGGQQTIGIDPLNEHNCGLIFFLSPSFATGQFSIFRQMESGDLPLPLRQISPIHE